MTNPEINKAIKDYAIAQKNAEQNAKIMCGNPSEKDVQGCSDRMTVLAKAEKLLHTMKDLWDLPDLPPQLITFLEEDRVPWCSCSVQSNPKFIHPKCEIQRKRWFKAREELVKYGLGL